MLRSLGLALVGLLSLSTGSWVGLGGTSAELEAPWRAIEASAHRSLDAAEERVKTLSREHLARGASDPGTSNRETVSVPSIPRGFSDLVSAPVPIDPSLLPDPTPWLRLNPEAGAARAWLLAQGPHHPAGDGRRLVTLTFDDGPFPETTPTVLRLLSRHKVRATFFLIGRYLDGDRERAVLSRGVATSIVSEGHLLGNHTHDHELLTTLSHARALAQIEEGALSIERATGKRPLFFRPPYGQLDAFGSDVLRRSGTELVLWSVEVSDMLHEDSGAMFQSLTRQLEYSGGGIVLLHDIRPTTIPVLDSLLLWLRDHKWNPARPSEIGFEVVDLPTYLRATAESPQPFSDRKELEDARADGWRHVHPRLKAPPALLPSEGAALFGR